jgi:hypothetical protein
MHDSSNCLPHVHGPAEIGFQRLYIKVSHGAPLIGRCRNPSRSENVKHILRNRKPQPIVEVSTMRKVLLITLLLAIIPSTSITEVRTTYREEDQSWFIGNSQIQAAFQIDPDGHFRARWLYDVLRAPDGSDR